MYVLPLIGYIGLTLGCCFSVLAIAAALYTISELVEEHSQLAKTVLKQLIITVILLHILLLFDTLPRKLLIFSVACQACYAANLRRFPVVRIRSPMFLLSILLVISNHFFWFKHFSHPNRNSNRQFSSGYRYDQPSFTEIASFFGICVWLTPFALLISLGADELTLPSMGSEYATGEHRNAAPELRRHKRRNTGIAKATIGGVQQWLGETGTTMGLWKSGNQHDKAV